MNVYEEIKFLLPDAYNTLKPDWSKISEWVRYYAICADGTVILSETDIASHGNVWVSVEAQMGMWKRAGVVSLPLGIDWRLCKWQRPQEVTQ